MLRNLVLLLSVSSVLSQYNSQTFPDPRLDPFTCAVALPGPVCDPARILTDEERARIAQRIQQLLGVTAPIKNSSPACALRPTANLEIVVAVIDKIGSVPNAAVDIEKFANNLKRKYQNFQAWRKDVGICDTSVLIVNSRQDRQVFTVAGRDARISKDTLRKAFERNVGHFKEGRYAMGIEGMVEVIVSAYGNAHIVQTPTPDNLPSGFATHNGITNRAAGLPQAITDEKGPVIEEQATEIDEKDKVWIEVMQLAMARCGENKEKLPQSVRAVVEEAMAISLQLISDTRYNAIEEEVDSHKDVLGIRETAWTSATNSFILPLYQKYSSVIHSGSSSKTCPSASIGKKVFRLL